ncbi:RPA-interacting protein isoform X2 [Delphinus delphis]|uniref:RPA-interacting protein isoform X2 n=1 Tax=Delphinus delphis TaxID=9728 RepID=UPI0028C4107F|nr:RPA-interacting protein isoform X2 [Delphinus delphis]
MWDPPRPGHEPVSPASAGGLSTTAPPGKPINGTSLVTHSGIVQACLRVGPAGRTTLPRIPYDLVRPAPKNYNSQDSARAPGAGPSGGDSREKEMAEGSGSRHRSLYKLVGSPPWKEAFRQGCLERMRNSRDRLLNKYRQAGGNMSGGAQNTFLVQEVMEEEWNALQSAESRPEALAQLEEPLDLAVLEEIQQELIDQEQSIISEYEKSLQFDEKCLSVMLAEWEANSLICPVCTKYNLRIASGVVMCQCGLYIPSHSPEVTEQKFRACLEDSVNEHSACCPHTPAFSVTEGTEEKPSLLMSCLACDTWAVIL